MTFLAVLASAADSFAEMPSGDEYTNSIGVKFIRIEPGTFRMGLLAEKLPWDVLPYTYGRGDRMDPLIYGDYDEKPAHTVRITRPFYMAVCEVTNSQYEQFDPVHSIYRGKEGFSSGDREAVTNVSWNHAQALCRWLSRKEGLPYRLPTEAEWEYACRAGTTTIYNTGNSPEDKFVARDPDVSLEVGRGSPNRWGLYDMHGNVEEWCYDWYGPYVGDPQTDPVGYQQGFYRVTRGGSHNTQAYWLRSANRMGTVPEDKHWLIGIRLVIGDLPETRPLPALEAPPVQHGVIQRDRHDVKKGPSPDEPYFSGPRRYVNIPRQMNGPIYAMHNHSPGLAACPNGDLIASWFTCISERNREPAAAASRLKRGSEEWSPACLFWYAPDRNSTSPSMWFDGDQTVYWFTGISVGDEYKQMASVMRTSTDSGATWSEPVLISGDHSFNLDPSQGNFARLQDNTIACSRDYGDNCLFLISGDGCRTWHNTGGFIRGIHCPVVQLKDGRLLAFGRGSAIDGTMAQSMSDDLGRTWRYCASEFPDIGGGQRSVMLRLEQGPIFFASFADWGIQITDSSGEKRKVRGLFAAVSTDEGATWPYKRLVTDDGPGKPVECTNGGVFLMGQRTAEYKGYMAVTQSLDGLIHLITSRQHYTFNLKWLMTPAPEVSAPQYRVKALVETFNGKEPDNDGWVEYRSYTGGLNGKGQYTVNSLYRMNGLTRLLGKGSLELNATIKNIAFDPGKGGKTPGPYIWFRDPRQREFYIRFDKHHIALKLLGQKATGEKTEPVRYETPPESAKVRLIWSEDTLRMRVFYGLDGKDATTELPLSKSGIYFNEPFSETTALCLLADHARADFDHLQIRPLNP